MIVRKTLDLFIVFKVARRRIAIIATLAVTVTILHIFYGIDVAIDNLPASILGMAMAIMLGFRVNSAYERWWEGRRIWGAVVNDSRSMARQVITFFSQSEDLNKATEEIKKFLYRQIAFTYALKNHLRRVNAPEEIRAFLSSEEFEYVQSKSNKPNAIILRHAIHLKEQLGSGSIEDFRHMQIDAKLSALCDSMGACERLKNTIFPRQYSYYTTHFVAIFTYILPFIFVSKCGWFTIPFSILVGFIFFALDSIARAIENPFENTYNDIPMTSICRTIEINLKEMMDEKNIPLPVEPINGFLY